MKKSNTPKIIAWILFIPVAIVSLIWLLPSFIVYCFTMLWAKKSQSNVSEESNPGNST